MAARTRAKRSPGGRGAPRIRAGLSPRQARLNKLAQQAGFRNDYHYRKLKQSAKVQDFTTAEGLKRINSPEVRRALVALVTGRARLAGRKGSPARRRAIARLTQEMADAELDIGAFFEAIGSPKRGKR